MREPGRTVGGVRALGQTELLRRIRTSEQGLSRQRIGGPGRSAARVHRPAGVDGPVWPPSEVPPGPHGERAGQWGRSLGDVAGGVPTCRPQSSPPPPPPQLGATMNPSTAGSGHAIDRRSNVCQCGSIVGLKSRKFCSTTSYRSPCTARTVAMWPNGPYDAPYTTIAPGTGVALSWKPSALATPNRSIALPDSGGGGFQRGSPACITAHVPS